MAKRARRWTSRTSSGSATASMCSSRTRSSRGWPSRPCSAARVWPSRTFRWANRHSRTRSSLRCEPWEKTPDRKPFPATMTTKMLCGILAPTAGQMQLAGETGSLRSQAVRQQLGYMSQKFSLYDDLSIEENLAFFAGVYGVPGSERAARRHWALSFAGLEGKEKLVTGSLTGGWKHHVALGAAIMHEPSILFLDGPTSGVDPLARRAFWKVINRLADLGTAILVTTHYLEEAEQCNRIGFMVAGEVVAEGTPGEIKGRQEGTLLELSVDKPQLASDVLKQDLDRWRVSLFGDRLHVISDDTPIRGIEGTTSRLARHGIRVLSAREVPFSLEDVFIRVVGKARQQRLGPPANR